MFSNLVPCWKCVFKLLEAVGEPKNEIALAYVIDVPSRGINHKTFTDIRKIAHEKNLSMYQVFI